MHNSIISVSVGGCTGPVAFGSDNASAAWCLVCTWWTKLNSKSNKRSCQQTSFPVESVKVKLYFTA